mmetsp:Transcript_133209/g.385462  ORF Transcript_133209/g.385462 Transcript_133209/m.385462 type:complete len:84 (+) Transcript_133209:1722-1973(+)
MTAAGCQWRTQAWPASEPLSPAQRRLLGRQRLPLAASPPSLLATDRRRKALAAPSAARFGSENSLHAGHVPGALRLAASALHR